MEKYTAQQQLHAPASDTIQYAPTRFGSADALVKHCIQDEISLSQGKACKPTKTVIASGAGKPSRDMSIEWRTAAKKNETTISQMTSLLKAEKAA